MDEISGEFFSKQKLKSKFCSVTNAFAQTSKIKHSQKNRYGKNYYYIVLSTYYDEKLLSITQIARHKPSLVILMIMHGIANNFSQEKNFKWTRNPFRRNQSHEFKAFYAPISPENYKVIQREADDNGVTVRTFCESYVCYYLDKFFD
jgi:hypothetical protein